MRRLAGLGVLLVLAVVLWQTGGPGTSPDPGSGPGAASLPIEARQTIGLIDAGGPFPHDRDGAVFQNRERRLPERERGYWREYTVPTPGSDDRGARRLVAGEDGDLYYTDDHYDSFRRIRGPS